MDSINPAINAIHRSYCDATGFEINMSAPIERRWFDALNQGMTPDDVKLIIKTRLKRIRDGVRHPESLFLKNIAGSDEAIADALVEAAAARATMRIKAFPAGKAQALRDSGRDDEPESPPARPISEVIQAMRRAVG